MLRNVRQKGKSFCLIKLCCLTAFIPKRIQTPILQRKWKTTIIKENYWSELYESRRAGSAA